MQVSVGKVKPIKVLGVVFVARAQCKPAVTVFLDDVLADGTALRKGDFSILDEGGLTEGIQVFDRLRREKRVALVNDKCVVNS